MALGGGAFIAQNKMMPGAYINFVSAHRASSAMSDRGIATIPLTLDWGVDGAVFTVTAEEFMKHSMRIFGYPYTHDNLKGLRDLFSNIKAGHFYKLNDGGQKASNIYADALYTGTRGNALTTVIEEADGSTQASPVYDVYTFLDGTCVDEQTVADATMLNDNGYLSFKSGAALALTAGTPLTGGTDGTVSNAAYQVYLDKIEPFSFNTMGCLSTDPVIKSLFANFTKRMRDDCGVKFQTVLFQPGNIDYEGVIGVENGLAGDAGDPSAIWWITGAQAGCPVNRSLTNAVYGGEYDIGTAYTQLELENALRDGKFILHRVGDDVRVLEDINTFISVTGDKSSDFSSNQTIRVIDQIGNDIAVLFNTKYLGKVPNDAAGRVSLWNDIVKHHQELRKIRAIDDFSGDDVTVEAGDSKKAVVVTDRVMPVNAMTQLYMTVIVQ